MSEEDLAPLKKLQDDVKPLPFAEVKSLIEEETGVPLESFFSELIETPLGSASIAQVHKGVLTTGETVVIKVQRPHIARLIQDDISVLYFVAGLMERYIPESRLYQPSEVVRELAHNLELETNFLVEANNIRRFRVNFQDSDTIVIPKVYLDLSSERLLILEFLDGVPLSKFHPNSAPFEVDREFVVNEGLKAFYQMVFTDGLFHGDLHAGNFFLLPHNQIGLVDFGVVGRLTPRIRSIVATLLIALAQEDYDHLAQQYLEIAPFQSATDPKAFARDLRDLLAPFYGLSLKNVNLGQLLLETSTVAAQHQVLLPTELLLFFKSIIHIESIGRSMIDDYDFLSHAIKYSYSLMRAKYHPKALGAAAQTLARESFDLIRFLPLEIKSYFRRVNHPSYVRTTEIKGLDLLQSTLQSFAHLLFLSILIFSLMLSATLILIFEKGPVQLGLPLLSLIGFGLAGLLGFVSVIKYLKR